MNNGTKAIACAIMVAAMTLSPDNSIDKTTPGYLFTAMVAAYWFIVWTLATIYFVMKP